MDRSVSYEAVFHLQTEDVYVSAWMSGSKEGEMTDPMAKAKWKATVDVAQGTESMRVKAQLSMFDGMEYMRIDSIEGEEALLNGLSLQSLAGKWIRKPMGDTPSMDMMTNEWSFALEMLSPMLFTLQHNRFPGGHAYILTSNMLPNAMELMPVDMKITVNTDPGDNANFVRVEMRGEDPMMDTAFELTAKVQTISGHVNVDVPKESMSIEEAWDMFGMSALDDTFLIPEILMPDGDMPPMEEEWMPDMPMEDSWEDDAEWSMPMKSMHSPWVHLEDSDADRGCTEEIGTPAYLREMRLGLCDDLGPGRSSPLRRGEGKEWYHNAILR
jgi:hypothetical protein